MGEAIERFYPKNNWDVQSFAKKQAEEIQIIADSKGPYPNRNGYKTSLLIYDNGEGQHPKDFEGTFLSLVRGNKNKVHFVQGKYNMGGSGAIVFCGKKRYQLIASKRFDNTGDFGFTLIREHPKRESDQAKETWYEYLVLDDKIPSFKIDTLDLGLKNRKFKTGSVIKLYSYQLGRGYSSAISHDLNQSINEFLFKPALPVLTVDSEKRYPNDKVLVNDLFGLKRRLEKEKDKYISDSFSEVFKDDLFGEMKVSCFVFNLKVGSFDLKKSKAEIQRRYFKNNMSVMFSMNGQVHGSYTSEFITRSLKLNLLKNHLLIHVDCTNMKYEFRKELFMASRDRLKEGDETRDLRHYLASKLSDKDARLSEIQKLRKQAVNIDTSTNTNQLIKNFTKSLPLNSDLMKLLGDTFKLDLKKENKKDNKDKKKNKLKEESLPFSPKRFPSFFKINSKVKGDTEVAKIPLNGEKVIRFSSDCEDSYFDRVEEPGELKIAILTVKSDVSEGGDQKGEPKDIEEVFNVNTSSPNKGTIKINLNPKKDKINIGDSVQMKVSLTAPGGDFEELFWVKVSEPEKPKEKIPKKDGDEEPLGLPQMIFAYEKPNEDVPNAVSWEGVEEATGLDVDIKTVMIPEAEGSTLKRIFINMDSSVLMNFKSKYRNPNEEQIELANRKYYTSVYFHTLFLYTITKNKGYEIKQKVEGNENLEDVDVGQYLKDLFDNYYSTFILNFGGMEEMMDGLGD
ncbi:hypothetical protein D6T69_09850 [Tenacibaculum singaporense]|uniref:Histidine kinase-, DNA gyrase B-, and HSP90-like ATPase n=2 Tax=Tenacibaculum singaporense TaxID=2358479 RepID=A0A3Q8RTK5_9FLAO|nr:hypothetical protein D6T69_09850 [Tenacibaculum singaporense]